MLRYGPVLGVQQLVQLQVPVARVALELANLAGQLSVQIVVAVTVFAAAAAVLIAGLPALFLLFLGFLALLGLLLLGGFLFLLGLEDAMDFLKLDGILEQFPAGFHLTLLDQHQGILESLALHVHLFG